MTCPCSSRFDVRLARPSDYAAFKKLLDVGKHPAFIGKATMMRNASQGGAIFYEFERQRIAVSLVNPRYGILLALNVHPAHRGHGLGAAIVRFLIPNFVRAIEDKVEWFEMLGYRRIGKMKRGISLNTQVLARAALFDLAGNLRKAWCNDFDTANNSGEALVPRKEKDHV